MTHMAFPDINGSLLTALLTRGESENLEWKAAFPSGLQPDRRGDERDVAKGTFLKDLVALANGEEDGFAYLVYGVKDHGSTRTIVGIRQRFDDATFQLWVENYFDPIIRFRYGELDWEGNLAVGIFAIARVPTYPHVVHRTLGKVLHDGQVWLRRGTKNTIAHHADLRRMIMGTEPFRIRSSGYPKTKELIAHFRRLGETACLPHVGDRDVKLDAGYRIAYLPGTRREVWVGEHDGRYEHILMLGPREAGA